MNIKLVKKVQIRIIIFCFSFFFTAQLNFCSSISSAFITIHLKKTHFHSNFMQHSPDFSNTAQTEEISTTKRPSRRKQRARKRSHVAALQQEAHTFWQEEGTGVSASPNHPRENREQKESCQEGIDSEMMCKVTASDLKVISFQLGYTPTNLVEVAARKSDGTPAVLLLHPLAQAASKRDKVQEPQPFPTIYWLSCPELKQEVSKLEKAGGVERFQKILQENPELLESMKQSHCAYEEKRWSMLQEKEKEKILSKGWLRAFEGVGIGGMRNFAAIKCLHMHYAHYLASNNNVVGSWVNDHLLNRNGQLEENVNSEIDITK
mmetsp:Transcript_26142/g.34347  ORF Transcript_26142/g.34347 Transcript_26142/m.34347 type:complete len:320 (+) Transcript_26142:42-1001(+)